MCRDGTPSSASRRCFLTAFAREPSPEELEKFASYVDRGGATGDKKKALADVFWVLLNSPEFLFNH